MLKAGIVPVAEEGCPPITFMQAGSLIPALAGDQATKLAAGGACMHIHHQPPDALRVVVSRVQVCSRPLARLCSCKMTEYMQSLARSNPLAWNPT